MHLRNLLCLITFSVAFVLAAPVTVTLENATVVGTSDGVVERFLGIPFAIPPLNELRYQLPQAFPGYAGTFDATSFGHSCPQQRTNLPIFTGIVANITDLLADTLYPLEVSDSESCLTLNVVRPVGAGPSSKLPVLVFLHEGNFELGGSSLYDGGVVVGRSIDLGVPLVYVSINYRLSGFGFLASKEVQAAGVGNLGLHDQRLGLRWIRKYISMFGGDPTKVTIWGDGAGAISVSLHMLHNRGKPEGLFRAAFMQSGAPLPVGNATDGQKYYDFVVKNTGCADSQDTLACLRTVPYDKLKAAIFETPGALSYQSLNLAWLPRTDGIFLADHPQRLVEQGNCDDEGTLYALSSLNVTTTPEFAHYVSTNFFPVATEDQITQVIAQYPQDAAQGSPFDTGDLNAITPQYKRIAAVLGDAAYQAPRRWFLSNTLPTNPNVWAYLYKRQKLSLFVGSRHGSDISSTYGQSDVADYLISFAATLDPNAQSLQTFQWPKFSLSSPQLLTFLDGLPALAMTTDTHRVEGTALLTNITLFGST